MCQVLARLAVLELQAWRASLAPTAFDGAATQRPELALFVLAISVAIGLDGTWLPVAETRVHFVVAAPEQDPIIRPEPAVVPDSVRQFEPSLIVPSETTIQCWAATFAQLASSTVEPETAIHLPGSPETTLPAGRAQCSPDCGAMFAQVFIVGLAPLPAFAFG